MEERKVIQVVYGGNVVFEKDVTGCFSEEWWMKRRNQFGDDSELIELLKSWGVTFHFELTHLFDINPIVKINEKLIKAPAGIIDIKGRTMNKFIDTYVKKGSPAMVSFHDDIDESWEIIGATEDKIIPAHYEDTYDWICTVVEPKEAKEWALKVKSFNEYMVRKLRREGKDWYHYSLHPLHAYPVEK